MSFDRSAGENREGVSVEPTARGAPGTDGVTPGLSTRTVSSTLLQTHHKPVTLAFLSEHLHASLISEQLAASLAAETNESVLLVRLAQGDAQPGAAIGSQQARKGFSVLMLPVGSDGHTAAIASQLAQLNGDFQHILIEVLANDGATPWLLDLLLNSNPGYLFLRPATEDVYRLGLVMHEVRGWRAAEGSRIKPIVCLGAGEAIDGFDILTQRVAGAVHMFVRGCPSAAANGDGHGSGYFAADVRRLAREVGGCLVGLALSSGAAKGFAHIGVIQVLEENGIEIDVIAGSSMGAYVGSLWAHGNDGAELERLAREMEGRWRLWSLIDPVFPPRRGFLKGFAVKKRLMRSIGHARFADLAKPMRIVAGNLATLERVTFSGGEVATAVHASIAVPGICVPITIDGETYIDGGIVDPLPVDVLREMGVHRIIAVNVIPTPDRIRYGLQAERELARTEGDGTREVLVNPLDKQLNYFAKGNLFETLMRSIYGAQIRVAEASCSRADLVLRPDICDDRWLDFRHPGKFIALGREVAERHLEEIKRLAARQEVSNERERAQETVAATA